MGKRIVISFYNEVAQDWKQDGSNIQMQLPDPHSAVTSQQQLDRITGTVQSSQQQLDRITGTVQRMMEVELKETEMWLALCELDKEYYVSSYNPSYIAQTLNSPNQTDDTTEDGEGDEGYDEENVGEDAIANPRVLCFYHPWDCPFHPRHATRPCGPLPSSAALGLLFPLVISDRHETRMRLTAVT